MLRVTGEPTFNKVISNIAIAISIISSKCLSDSCGIIPANNLDFRTGVLCLRAPPKCALKASEHIAYAIESRLFEGGFVISKCTLYEIEEGDSEDCTADGCMEVIRNSTGSTGSSGCRIQLQADRSLMEIGVLAEALKPYCRLSISILPYPHPNLVRSNKIQLVDGVKVCSITDDSVKPNNVRRL